MVGALLKTEDDIQKASLISGIVDDNPGKDLFVMVGDIWP